LRDTCRSAGIEVRAAVVSGRKSLGAGCADADAAASAPR
jgi:hypothetical protein